VFENIWEQTESVMRIAFKTAPDAPPPWPIAQMLMAPILAGYPLDPMIGADLDFGMWVALMMVETTKTAAFSVKDRQKPKAK
jgi:hypothetical protein